jgi:hypothetical protein
VRGGRPQVYSTIPTYLSPLQDRLHPIPFPLEDLHRSAQPELVGDRAEEVFYFAAPRQRETLRKSDSGPP